MPWLVAFLGFAAVALLALAVHLSACLGYWRTQCQRARRDAGNWKALAESVTRELESLGDRAEALCCRRQPRTEG